MLFSKGALYAFLSRYQSQANLDVPVVLSKIILQIFWGKRKTIGVLNNDASVLVRQRQTILRYAFLSIPFSCLVSPGKTPSFLSLYILDFFFATWCHRAIQTSGTSLRKIIKK